MKRKFPISFAIGLMLLAATPLLAQVGCVNSPENPTAVLALIGSAGALVASARSRMRMRNRVKLQ